MRLICAAVLLLLAHPAAADHTRLTAQMQADVTMILKHYGYNCPLAKSIHYLDQNAYGDVFHVRCGPADSDGFYEFASFRITSRPNNTIFIVPCSFRLCKVGD